MQIVKGRLTGRHFNGAWIFTLIVALMLAVGIISLMNHVFEPVTDKLLRYLSPPAIENSLASWNVKI